MVDPVALDADAPSQVELTTVLAAGSKWDGEPMTHCWTIDIRRGSTTGRSRPSCWLATTLRRSRRTRSRGCIRCRITASSTRRLAPGGTWQVHQLAKAGHGLLPHENDYTGLVAIDPYDLDSLYVSTPIDPRDGAALTHHEIFHARTADAGATWTWTPVTENSDRPTTSARSSRPVIPRRVPLLWFRGDMTASQHYDCEVVLLDHSATEIVTSGTISSMGVPVRRLWVAVLCGYLAFGATLQALPSYVPEKFGGGALASGTAVGIAFLATACGAAVRGLAGGCGLVASRRPGRGSAGRCWWPWATDWRLIWSCCWLRGW